MAGGRERGEGLVECFLLLPVEGAVLDWVILCRARRGGWVLMVCEVYGGYDILLMGWSNVFQWLSCVKGGGGEP